SNNIVGIKINNIDNVSINRNDIVIGDGLYAVTIPPNYFIGAGIGVFASTGYLIEENDISSTLNIGQDVGIYIKNSGADNNRVYKNTMTGLTYGTYADGQNRSYSELLKGLEFRCNNYINNNYGIAIQKINNDDGIKLFQGSLSKA